MEVLQNAVIESNYRFENLKTMSTHSSSWQMSKYATGLSVHSDIIAHTFIINHSDYQLQRAITRRCQKMTARQHLNDN